MRSKAGFLTVLLFVVALPAIITAFIIAKGTTNIHRIYHLDRGYEDLEAKLTKLGAQISRLEE